MLEAEVHSMPISKFVCNVSLALLGVALPAMLHAQFQNATPDELKMTADPKAPGASAVYLNVTEIADNSLHFESFYARIKILTEKGEDLATVELPYQRDEENQYQVTAIQGRTIHPDGSIVQLTGKPADLLVAKNRDTKYGRKVFTLPSMQVGSIIEYYYQLRYNDDYYYTPTWIIQRPYLVHKAHYLYTPYSGQLTFWTVLPHGAAVSQDALGHFSLDLTDIPPAPNEEWMPPMESTLFRVEFYTSGQSTDVNVFWQKLGNSWSKSVEQLTEPSKPFREVVNGLIAPGDSDLDKAKKLYKAVQTLENTDFSREKSEAERKALRLKTAKRAEDLWTQKSGSGVGISLLYLSMLRAAGLNGYAMRLVDRSRSNFAPGYMYFDQLDAMVILLSIDGKEIVLDPGEKMCPFQAVSWRHSLATGVRQTAGGGSAIATSPHQPYTANTLQRIGDITLDSHGGVDGNLRFVMSGQEALYWRQKALENDEDEVKKQFDTWIGTMVPDGVEAHVDHFISLDDADSNLAAVIKAQGTAGTATSKRVLIPGLFFETRGSHPFVDQDKRLTPVDMHYGEMLSDDVTYNLPPGLVVESVPQPSKVPWEGKAVMVIKSKTDPGEVTITRTLARSFTFASTEDYQNLRDFYQKVATADQQQLVLTASTAGKGN
jgi:hypothetical protein